MPYHRALRLVVLTLCGILVPAVLTGLPAGEPSVVEPVSVHSSARSPPTWCWLPVGGEEGSSFPPYTSELEPEDTTHLHRLDAGDGSLGPGAIGAIVIASLLGTSVLVALVVITLRKFSAS
ncbi:PREDICTED: uncharacterized protein C2orf82 homolog [Eurypyga helias]|uniref:uncharacterized protein C2orf82 homolog n=1 Tax=Eurypyga helias TaxID=54383 RepID=UPI000528E692|nr:PREDICTED: uncharacterized protein C2orf82 homolog [Eurypyga helias]